MGTLVLLAEHGNVRENGGVLSPIFVFKVIKFIIPFLLFSSLFAQKRSVAILSLEKEQINPVLLQEVDKFILKKENDTPLFKSGYGYVMISNIKLIDTSPYDFSVSENTNIAVTFQIGLSSYFVRGGVKITESFCENCYPTYYFKHRNHLIVLYDELTTWITTNKFDYRSQQKFEKSLKKVLSQSLQNDFVFWDIFKKENYKISATDRKKMKDYQILQKGAFVLSEGYKVVIFQDGHIEHFERE